MNMTTTKKEYSVELRYYGPNHTNPRWFPNKALRAEICSRVEAFPGGARGVEDKIGIPHRGMSVHHLCAGKDGGSKYLKEICEALGIEGVEIPVAESPVVKPPPPRHVKREPTPSVRRSVIQQTAEYIKQVNEIEQQQAMLEARKTEIFGKMRDLGMPV
jgi:hypothetical protein